MKIERIREKVKVGKYIISFTHTEKMRLRKIEAQDIPDGHPKSPTCISIN